MHALLILSHIKGPFCLSSLSLTDIWWIVPVVLGVGGGWGGRGVGRETYWTSLIIFYQMHGKYLTEVWKQTGIAPARKREGLGAWGEDCMPNCTILLEKKTVFSLTCKSTRPLVAVMVDYCRGTGLRVLSCLMSCSTVSCPAKNSCLTHGVKRGEKRAKLAEDFKEIQGTAPHKQVCYSLFFSRLCCIP